MADPWEKRGNSIDSPAENAAAVSKDDDNDLPTATRALYIGGDGNVSVDMVGGQESIVFVGLTAGTILPIRATRVNSTGTTATNIVALW